MLNNGYTYIDKILRSDDGVGALEYYAARHPHFTRDEWVQRFREGQITRDGRPLAEEQTLRAGQLLRYFRLPWEEPEVPDHIDVLFEDGHVMVFNKPDRMPVIPGGEYLENSMALSLRKKHGALLAPLHRLGRGTTGAILFTRTMEAAAAFSDMMRKREIGKTYLALVHGTNMPDTFTIDTPIGRVPHARLGDIHDVNPNGKPSISHCTVLARRASDNTALVQVAIPTGRTHQIRIHLASAGHPLLGDEFYRGPQGVGENRSGESASALPGDAGYILHSWKLLYNDPFTNVATAVVAPVRDEIVQWQLATEREQAEA